MSFRPLNEREKQSYLVRINNLKKRVKEDLLYLKRLLEEVERDVWVSDKDYSEVGRRLELLGYSKDDKGYYTIFKGES